ncbi:DUF799 domain-containing protein [Pseudomonas sp. GCM10022186]|uniref:DUF799 domain-containing protein n=1 Tax=Pseudomonas sp. GCM10022186 TaxID=3252650 RepID=UPI00361B3FF4
MMARLLKGLVYLVVVGVFAGCAEVKTVDYSAFKESRPRSIIVLPPMNESPDVQATYGLFSQVTLPLAEAGYYVMPVALVDETFRQNGVTAPGDIHQVAPKKLRKIFGADAALYITVKEYGTSYKLISSETAVTASAKLVDLNTGAALWTGTARASSEEGNNQNSGGLVGLLIAAAVKQIVSGVQEDAAYPIAGLAAGRLLSAGRSPGILYGPRSPKYMTD